MTPNIVRVAASTREDRNEMIALVRDAIIKSGGWIIDHTMFSNAVINISFEVPANNVDDLFAALRDVEGLKLDNEEVEEIESQFSSGGKFDVPGTLQITFIHDEPDLRIEVPPIPG